MTEICTVDTEKMINNFDHTENLQGSNKNKIDESHSNENCTKNVDPQDTCTWDENEYSCNDETASAASFSSSLGSHESNEFNESSGYNSSGNDGEIKCKLERELDKFLSLSVVDDSALVDSDDAIEHGINQGNNNIVDPNDLLKFHEAVRIGDSKKVEELLGKGAIIDIDEPNWNVSGDPPLLVAATNHCFEVLRILLAKGCNAGTRSPRGETALHRVIINRGPFRVRKFVEELLKHGCPPGVKEAGGGLTALHMFTRQLVHAYPSKASQVDFQVALDTLDILAKAGAINEEDHQGRNVLHILASSTAFDNCRDEIESVIKILLEAGVNPTTSNCRGETPLHEALEFGALNTADLLLSHTPIGLISRYGETPLHIAARKNYVQLVEKLVKLNENSSIQDAGGNTPVHLAAARGFHHVVHLLITCSTVELESINDEGLTALQVAAESGFIDTVRVLIEAGADLTFMDDSTKIHHRHPDISIIIEDERTRRNRNLT